MTLCMLSGMANSRSARMALVASLVAISIGACAQDQQAAKPTATAPTAAAPAAKPMGGMAHTEGMDHSHMMTPEQMADLRRKVPLYAVSTDEQIMSNMKRMPPDFWGLISSKDLQGAVGVVALGHGYTLGGNEQFQNYAGPISKVHPTVVAPGMAMMSSSHIQAAVDELTGKHGVKTIVAVPMEMGDETSLVRQWKYIFGLEKDAAWLAAPQVKTTAKVIFTSSPAASSRVSTILRDYAVAASADPARDRLILVSHGPETEADNPAELAVLEKHAAYIRKTSTFTDVKAVSLQDDAVPPVRAAHVAELRAFIQEARAQGRGVVIVPMLLTKGGFHARLQKDLAGLDYQFANRGVIEHPEFQEWIKATVREASGG